MSRLLVTGGTRSGKSSYAEQRFSGEPVRYLATGYPASGRDPEWDARLALHRSRRPVSWTTFETLDLTGHLTSADTRPILVDCAALWLTRTLDELDGWSRPGPASTAILSVIDTLAAALEACSVDVVVVTNEVGSGVVPGTASGRIFADLLGILNMRLAGVCEEVVLMVAGIPLTIKGAPHDA